MPDSASWEAFGAVAGVIVFLGGLAFALQRLGILRRAAPPQSAPKDAGQAGQDERYFDLERRVSILEERTRAQGGSIERLGHVHKRIDQIAATVSHTDGKIEEMGRSMRLVQQHLMGTSA